MYTWITATVCLCDNYLYSRIPIHRTYLVTVNQYTSTFFALVYFDYSVNAVLWIHELLIAEWHRHLCICKTELWPVMLELTVSAARHRHLCFCEPELWPVMFELTVSATGHRRLFIYKPELWPVMLELTISAARHRHLWICKPELWPMMLELTVSAARHRHLCFCEPVLWDSQLRGIDIYVSLNPYFDQWCLSSLFHLRGIAI